ncbi:alkyl sulfatase dimerization domain-containing protein [Dankookia sp. P2]|uniref:alkyl sulfatase dimerization domain-containing protein n=1 Tax=Dankookia sp. P2 TaxID=3423955 RepID=UPI003D66F661
MVRLPPELERNWATRGYYGTVSHNARAVYNFYLGFFSGNPAELEPLPPVQAAPRYVALMGGAEGVLRAAQQAYDAGDYRWCAQLLQHLVFAQPDNAAAKNLQADAFEQLGYQTEAATWRNFYFAGAQELRSGLPTTTAAMGASPDLIRNLPLEQVFDYLGIQLDAAKTAGKAITINFEVEGGAEKRALVLRNGVLNHLTKPAASPDLTVRGSVAGIVAALMGGNPDQAVARGLVQVQGRATALNEIAGHDDGPGILVPDRHPAGLAGLIPAGRRRAIFVEGGAMTEGRVMSGAAPSDRRGGGRDRRHLLLNGSALIAAGALGAAAPVNSARAQPARPAGRRPNIVLILADNLGYGELRLLRRRHPPRRPDAEDRPPGRRGTRLLNFNVEPQCTPSRSALITGRHPIRSGTYSVPIDGRPYGPVRWEVTIADLLSGQGYATGIFGKWHLGDSEGRYPHDRGFDEWYGIPNSSDESFWPQQPGFDPAIARPEHVMEGHRGETPREVKVYDAVARREIDPELTARTVDFMRRSVQAGKPFLAYVPFTLVHAPTEPSRQFAGRTGRGDWADVLAQMDWSVGQILDAVAEAGHRGRHHRRLHERQRPRGDLPLARLGGPVVRLLLHRHGRLAAHALHRPLAGPGPRRPGEQRDRAHHRPLHHALPRRRRGDPQDRPVDGLDQTAFLGGEEKSAREWFPVYVNNELYAVKWRNWKLHFVWQQRMDDAPQHLGGGVRLFNLDVTPQERPDESLPTGFTHGWVVHGIFAALAPFQESLKRHPPIPMGTGDPYTPGAHTSGPNTPGTAR